MNSFRQFLALLRYHSTANPWIWVFPLAFAPQGFVMGFHQYRFNLELANIGASQMFWLPLLFASFLFGSQMFQGMAGLNASTNIQMQAYSPEFIVTRAVDRKNVYWARAALYWLLVLIPVALWISTATASPSFTMELKPDKLQTYLTQLPGSFLQATKDGGNSVIMVPFGSLWLRLWASAQLLFAAAIWQLFIFLIMPSRRALWYYWGAFIICIPLMIGSQIWGRKQMETAFLFTVNHWMLFVAVFAVTIPAVLFYSKRRFLDQEF